MQQAAFDFPVGLQPLYTKDGLEAPRVQAVVREDTNVPLAVVGKRYRLIPHQEVISQARSFIQALGRPNESYTVGRNGALLVGTLTYREHAAQVAKGDTVALRVYIGNSYNATRSLEIRIGALVLSCLNGMTTPRTVYNYVWRHTTSVVIKFPKPDEILTNFAQEVQRWRNYADLMLAPRGEQLVEAFHRLQPVLGSGMLENVGRAVSDVKTATVWDFMQACTYQLTHTSKATMIGKLNKLENVSKIIDDVLVRGYTH